MQLNPTRTKQILEKKTILDNKDFFLHFDVDDFDYNELIIMNNLNERISIFCIIIIDSPIGKLTILEAIIFGLEILYAPVEIKSQH